MKLLSIASGSILWQNSLIDFEVSFYEQSHFIRCRFLRLIHSRARWYRESIEVAIMIADYTKDPTLFEFCPDRFLDEKEYTAIAIKSELYIMNSRHFPFDGPNFRYPELYWC